MYILKTTIFKSNSLPSCSECPKQGRLAMLRPPYLPDSMQQNKRVFKRSDLIIFQNIVLSMFQADILFLRLLGFPLPYVV